MVAHESSVANICTLSKVLRNNGAREKSLQKCQMGHVRIANDLKFLKLFGKTYVTN